MQKNTDMKKVFLIITTLAIIAIIIIVSILYRQVPDEANVYINAQKEVQKSIAERQVDSLFVHKHTDIFPIYYECKSRYVKGDAYAQTGSWYKDLNNYSPNSLLKMPSDITSTYFVAPEDAPFFGDDVIEGVKTEIRVQNRNDDDIETGIHGVKWKGLWQTGWALGVRENFGLGRIAEYVIIPYAVSFRKQSFGTLEGYVSIDDILENAFKFYTENDKSDFKKSIVTNTKGFTYMPHIDNRYYYLEADKDASFVTMTISDYADFGTYMYNDSYYVFIKGYGRKMYKLVLNEHRVKYDMEQYVSDKRHTILTYGLVAIGIFLIIWLVLLVMVYKEGKERKRTLLERLKIKCNPKKFVKNYNGEKLKSANDIYSKAIAVDVNDESAIIELASRAENELGIFLISKNDIKELKELCNPKRFMKPYDAQKVERANNLFGKLSQGVVSYSAFVKIKEEISLLYEKNKEDSTSLATEDESSIRE